MHIALHSRREHVCTRGMSDMEGLLAELQTLRVTLERTERLSPGATSEVASQAAATLIVRINSMSHYSSEDNNILSRYGGRYVEACDKS